MINGESTWKSTVTPDNGCPSLSRMTAVAVTDSGWSIVGPPQVPNWMPMLWSESDTADCVGSGSETGTIDNSAVRGAEILPAMSVAVTEISPGWA